MIAIRVRYYPATNHRGSRLVATDGRHRLSVPYEYSNDDQEKLNAAIQFKLKYLPDSPELNPTPSQFNGDCYFSFYPKSDPEKLEELKVAMQEIGAPGMTVTQVYGCGLSKGHKEVYRGKEVNVNLLPYKVHDDRTCCMPTSAEPSAVSGHGNVGSLVHIGQ